METLPQSLNNQEYFPFEVKISIYTTLEEIKEKILGGEPVNFLVTKDLSIWITTGTHNSLTDHGITGNDVSCLGYIKITDNKPEVKFYDEPNNSRYIKNDILNFLNLK